MTATIVQKGIHKMISGTMQEIVDTLYSLNNPLPIGSPVTVDGSTFFVLTRG